jgi:hypothetical protein
MSLGPIPYGKIKQYGIDEELEDGVLLMFIDTIRAMDIAYLKDSDEEQKKKSPPRAPMSKDDKTDVLTRRS